MLDAYKTAAQMSDELIARERPQDLELLRRTQVVVVRGQYDRGEGVLQLCGIPSSSVDAGVTEAMTLDPDQVLFVNCPGHLPPGGLRRVRQFVEAGGLLVTTDWALKHVVETAFPGTIRRGGRDSRDDVVRVVFEPIQDTFLEGLLDPQDDPLWWLEGSSYPIEVLDPTVKVLVSSREMQDRYGHAPIVVAFEVGAGKVYHMTSHFYLQRTETRTARHQASAESYLRQKGFDPAESRRMCAGTSANLTETQSAYTSARALKNLVIEQGRRAATRKV